jgi:hypothetical protein
LVLLRDAIERAKQRNVSHAALSDTERLLAELPREVAAVLQETGRRLPLTPEGVPAYQDATEFVRDARHQIVQACLRVNELAE